MINITPDNLGSNSKSASQKAIGWNCPISAWFYWSQLKRSNRRARNKIGWRSDPKQRIMRKQTNMTHTKTKRFWTFCDLSTYGHYTYTERRKNWNIAKLSSTFLLFSWSSFFCSASLTFRVRSSNHRTIKQF